MSRTNADGNGSGGPLPTVLVSPDWALDLMIVAGVSVLAAGIILTPLFPDPLQWLFAIPFLIFFPGYALVSILFPEAPGHAGPALAGSIGGSTMGPSAPTGSQGGGSSLGPSAHAPEAPSWLARFTLALLTSPIIVGGLGVVLSPFGALQLQPVVVGLAAITLFGCLAGSLRRAQLAPPSRAAPLAGGLQSISAGVTATRMQMVALVAAVVILGGASAIAVWVPSESAAYTEAYLLSEDGVAADFPEEWTVGEHETLAVGIENHENRAITYEVVTVLQEVDADGTVQAESELDHFSVELQDGESTIEQRDLTADRPGERLRLQVRIHVDEFEGSDGHAVDDDQPRDGGADHVLQLWIDVTE